MEKLKTNQAEKLLRTIANDSILWRGYIGTDWGRYLLPRKQGFNFDGSFEK